MPFAIRRAGHVVLRMRDPYIARDFLEQVVGLQTSAQEGDSFFFLTAQPVSNHHMIAVRGGAGKRLPEPRRHIGMIGIAYEMTDFEQLQHLAERVEEHGARFGVTISEPIAQNDVFGHVFVCDDADGNRLEFFINAETAPERHSARAIKSGIRRTSHLNLRCADIERSQRFYEDVLHLIPVLRSENGRTYLSGDAESRLPVLGLEQAHDLDVPIPTPREMYGMEHFSLEVGSFDQLCAGYAELERSGVSVHHTMDHGVTNSVYFIDPDGNLMEIYHDVPRAEYRNPENPFGNFGAIDKRLAAHAYNSASGK
jgi:catechol 2,3-dioxygenase